MELTSTTIKVIKTCNLYALFLVMGICLIIPASTLVDLMHIIKTDVKTIAYIYPARATGMITGSLIASFVFDKIVRKQVLFMVLTLTLSISTFGIPWCKNIATLIVWMALKGICIGSISTSGNIFCIELWGKKNGPFYQALFFTYSVGAFVGPLLATPFLGNYRDTESNFTKAILPNKSYINNTIISGFQNSDVNLTPVSTIIYIYSIVSGFAFVVTILFFITCIVMPKEKRKLNNKISANKSKKLDTKYLLMLLMFIFVFNTSGSEQSYNQMVIIYVLNGPLQLSSIMGSYMISTFYCSFTLSRLFAIFLTIRIGSLAVLILHLTITSIGSLVLLFFSAHYEWALWLSSFLLGTGLAPLLPASVSWIEKYITETNEILGVMVTAYGVAGMLVPYVISCYIEENPDFFSYTIALNNTIAIVVIVFVFLIIKNIPNKYTIQKKVAASTCSNTDSIM